MAMYQETTQTNKNKMVVINKTGFYLGDFYTFNVCWLWDVSAWLLVKTLFFHGGAMLVSYWSYTSCYTYHILYSDTVAASWKPGLWDGLTGPWWYVRRAVQREGTFLQLPGLRAPCHSRLWHCLWLLRNPSDNSGNSSPFQDWYKFHLPSPSATEVNMVTNSRAADCRCLFEELFCKNPKCFQKNSYICINHWIIRDSARGLAGP